VSRQPFRHDPGERDSDRFRPRWWWFGLFALNVAVHLPRGWDSTAAIGLPLVFVPRLPRWLTWGAGGAEDSGDRKRLRPRPVGRWCLVAVAVVVVGLLAYAMVAEPPEPGEVAAAVSVWVVAAGFLLASVGWLLLAFRRPRAAPSYGGPLGLVPLDDALPGTASGPARPRALPEVVPSESPRGIAVAAQVGDGDTSQWDWSETVGQARITVTLPDGRPGYLTLTNCPGPLALAVVRTGKLWLSGKRLDGKRLDGKNPGGRVSAEFGEFTATGLLTTDPAGHVPGRRRRPWGASLRGLAWQYWLRVPVLVLAGAAVVAVPVAGFVWSGWAWTLLLPALIAGAIAAVWASETRDEHRDVGAAPLTPIDVRLVDDHLWPDREVWAWAVLEPGLPARLDIGACPPEIAAELLAHHRVWVFGEPRPGPVFLGRPGHRVYAAASFRAVPRRQRQPASSTPPGTGADGS
jgi:protein-S-isoprenylcysteine O-methyltransferase Ste14